MKPTAVLDPDGSISRLHLNPTERCNLDDANRVEEFSWEDAFRQIAFQSLDQDATEEGIVTTFPNIDRLLCDRCYG